MSEGTLVVRTGGFAAACRASTWYDQSVLAHWMKTLTAQAIAEAGDEPGDLRFEIKIEVQP